MLSLGKTLLIHLQIKDNVPMDPLLKPAFAFFLFWQAVPPTESWLYQILDKGVLGFLCYVLIKALIVLWREHTRMREQERADRERYDAVTAEREKVLLSHLTANTTTMTALSERIQTMHEDVRNCLKS